MVAAASRPARVVIDMAAIGRNTAAIAELVGPALVCAVVKADAYGHDAIEVARAAIEHGATWLAVAVVDEGLALRSACGDHPILLLSEPSPAAMDDAHGGWLIPTLYTDEGIDAAERSAQRGTQPWPVQLKVNTGMNRVGARPDDAVRLARRIVASEHLELTGVWTHLATADDPTESATDRQLDLYEEVLAAITAAGIDPGLRHAANSAATLLHPRARYDLVRPGIALYGVTPALGVDVPIDLEPALSVTAEVAFTHRVAAGEGISYGLRHVFDHDATVATVPVGYADGVARRLGLLNADVLIGGRRRRMVGAVTMDQLMVDCLDDDVSVGDEVVLLGRQGDELVTAEEWAGLLGLIPYEVICGFGPRLPRSTLSRQLSSSTAPASR